MNGSAVPFLIRRSRGVSAIRFHVTHRALQASIRLLMSWQDFVSVPYTVTPMPARLLLEQSLLGRRVVDLDKLLTRSRRLEGSRGTGSGVAIDLGRGHEVIDHVTHGRKLGGHAAAQVPFKIGKDKLGDDLTDTHGGG